MRIGLIGTFDLGESYGLSDEIFGPYARDLRADTGLVAIRDRLPGYRRLPAAYRRPTTTPPSGAGIAAAGRGKLGRFSPTRA